MCALKNATTPYTVQRSMASAKNRPLRSWGWASTVAQRRCGCVANEDRCARGVREGEGPLGGEGRRTAGPAAATTTTSAARRQDQRRREAQDGGAGGVREGHREGHRAWCARRLRRRRGEWRRARRRLHRRHDDRCARGVGEGDTHRRVECAGRPRWSTSHAWRATGLPLASSTGLPARYPARYPQCRFGRHCEPNADEGRSSEYEKASATRCSRASILSAQPAQ